jgi:hypothetical protein
MAQQLQVSIGDHNCCLSHTIWTFNLSTFSKTGSSAAGRGEGEQEKMEHGRETARDWLEGTRGRGEGREGKGDRG